MPYSVLIIEDDLQFRSAFADAVSNADDLRLAGVAEDLPDGLHLLEQTEPDMLLVDIGLPSGSGIELIRRAHERLPVCDVMVVTVFGDERQVLACIEAGATGYLLKETQGTDIVDQIRVLRDGGKSNQSGDCPASTGPLPECPKHQSVLTQPRPVYQNRSAPYWR